MTQTNVIPPWTVVEMDLDRFFRKYPPEEKQRLIRKALEFSDSAATSFARRFGPTYPLPELNRAAKDLFCTVTVITGKPACPFLSDFDPNSRRITLYKQNIDRFYAGIRDGFSSCFLSHTLEEMCLLHELCHVLEFETYGKIGGLSGIGETKTLFRRPREHRRLSEVAAHSFVQTLMELPCSPAEFCINP